MTMVSRAFMIFPARTAPAMERMGSLVLYAKFPFMGGCEGE